MAGPPSKKGRYHGDLANADAETGRVYVWDANRSAWRLTTTEDAVKFSTQAREHQKQKQNGTSESNVQITQGGLLVNGQFISVDQIIEVADQVPGLSVIGLPQVFKGPRGKNGITPRVVIKSFPATNFMVTSATIPKSDAIAIIGAQFLGGGDPPSIITPNEAELVVKDAVAVWDISSTAYGASGANIYCLSL